MGVSFGQLGIWGLSVMQLAHAEDTEIEPCDPWAAAPPITPPAHDVP